MPTYDRALFWFRRDLRLADNAGLFQALAASRSVHCVFVFDTEILEQLPPPADGALRADRRVEFIWRSSAELQRTISARGGALDILHGAAAREIPRHARALGAQAVFTNHDYEPGAIARDARVRAACGEFGIAFHSYKDQVLFERAEILTQSGRPYTVFTQYKNAWLQRLQPEDLRAHPVERYADRLARSLAPQPLPSLESLGFAQTDLPELPLPIGESGARKMYADFASRIDHYHALRDYPGRKGVSYLSLHLRFGTISIRALARLAYEREGAGASAWLNELIWRDFYFAILHHFPHVEKHAFRRQYEALAFENRPDYFAAWCAGRTGYPIVDAGMRQLNSTGYMHNRLRMICASFLVKDLLVDWRWGERYFAQRLNDFDLAANNGGWQWAASTGCDAQPYFRIFNPVAQSQKFDPEGDFIRRYIPQLARCENKHIHAPWTMDAATQARLRIGDTYPAPIVDHAIQRKRALDMYRRVRASPAEE